MVRLSQLHAGAPPLDLTLVRADQAGERARLVRVLRELGIEVTPEPPWLLCRAPGHPYVRARLLELGISVGAGEGPEQWRVAPPDRAGGDRLAAALWTMLCAV